MTVIDRREFLRRTGMSAAGLAALGGPLQGVFARGALASGSTGVAPNNGGYGPIGPVPDLADGVVRLHLPEGFQYRSFAPTGTLTTDGVITPGRHDGMAAFAWGRVATAWCATTRSTAPDRPSATPRRRTTRWPGRHDDTRGQPPRGQGASPGSAATARR